MVDTLRKLSDEEVEAFDTLHYLLDLAGFHYKSAYQILGLQSTTHYRLIQSPGIQHIRLLQIRAMSDMLRAELAKGLYPMQFENTEQEVEQLKRLFDEWISTHEQYEQISEGRTA